MTPAETTVSEAETSVGVGGQYLSFTLGGEDYGVDILRVQEIKGWEAVRPLPDTPDYVKGVLDLRGEIVPIIDLRTRLKLDHAEYTPTTVTIVLTVESKPGSCINSGATTIPPYKRQGEIKNMHYLWSSLLVRSRNHEKSYI